MLQGTSLAQPVPGEELPDRAAPLFRVYLFSILLAHKCQAKSISDMINTAPVQGKGMFLLTYINYTHTQRLVIIYTEKENCR